jgi:hypothetical protein
MLLLDNILCIDNQIFVLRLLSVRITLPQGELVSSATFHLVEPGSLTVVSATFHLVAQKSSCFHAMAFLFR